ncbi:MAG: hypothetical protein NTY86_04410 [Deltaproteobacteria bacterium]|nr:hypothetical protein [Deltaproteobacteria bacterium]
MTPNSLSNSNLWCQELFQGTHLFKMAEEFFWQLLKINLTPPTTVQPSSFITTEDCESKAATLAGECQEVFVAKVFTLIWTKFSK